MSAAFISPQLRQEVSVKSKFRCCYCYSQEDVSGMKFTIDHIIPQSLGGETEIDNLCLACWDCNLYKQNRISATDSNTNEQVPLYHPNHQEWKAHFEWQSQGVIISGLTATGRATIDLLRLNRAVLVRARERWIKVGWHPPLD